ncbi:MAG TPA: DeoR/GlpR transcriptional regulator, partial [Solirubrobacteraceae bacterium]|nr:DeoR/GlpR transcriptional regulator [Solirubrobacteraceae bacterium]
GVSDEGVLTDPDPFEAEVKRMMLARSRHPVLLLDGTKAGQVALAVVGDVSSVRTIICTGFEEPAVARMRACGVSVQAV